MTATLKAPSAAQMLASLVPSNVRTLIKWRKTTDGRIMDLGTDVLFARVGSDAPTRLLMLHSGDDGLVRIQLTELGRTSKVIATETALPDLVEFVLVKWADQYGLSK